MCVCFFGLEIHVLSLPPPALEWVGQPNFKIFTDTFFLGFFLGGGGCLRGLEGGIGREHCAWIFWLL